MSTRGKFIVLDGTEGAGKSTQLAILAEHLRNLGLTVVTTREPGGTPLAEEIRSSILKRRDETVDPLTETLLVWAARRQHVSQIIEPALAQGDWVICDRFIPSTLAYQVYGRGLAKSKIIDPFVGPVLGDVLWPDATLIFDVPPEVGTERARLRGKPDRMEQEDWEFFQRVRTGYQAYLEMDKLALPIDGQGSITQVAANIRIALTPLVRESLPKGELPVPNSFALG